MEEVSLNEAETRYYSDLFLCCDVESTGKIPTLKATELFRSADITNEAVDEITSLAGIPSAALHISRAQFYSCLKLIAAHQAGLPLRQELIAATVLLALPRFNWKDSSSESANCFNALPPPPPTDRRNSLQRRRNSAQQQQTCHAQHSDLPSTDSEVEPNECISGTAIGVGTSVASSSSRELQLQRTSGGSPEAWSTNSDSPTPTNSVTERPWAKDTLWQGLLGDEHRQLLGTEEESSDRHSSDEDDNEGDLVSLYQITNEQREYYYKQFKTVQRDTQGLLSGQAARVFFEKSRIPVDELRHIWQLCDVTRDGALSLSEFTAAMHLVVLRRNNIPLPSMLPPCLHPNVLQHSVPGLQEPPEADLLHLNDDEDDDNTDSTIIAGNLNNSAKSIIKARPLPETNVMNLSTISTTSQASNHARQREGSPTMKNCSISNSPNIEEVTTPPQIAATVVTLPASIATAAALGPSSTSAVKKDDPNKLWSADAPSTQWTKFTESPTATVSSPGLKPANFDIKRTAQEVGSNPQILHPVPLRVTPVGSASVNVPGNGDIPQQQSSNDEYSTTRDSSPKSAVCQQAQHQRDSIQLQNSDLRAIQRPHAKKLHGKNIGALPPPPQREPSVGSVVGDRDGPELVSLPNVLSKKEPPPLPPPRPHRHARSSSLDLNKFKANACSGGGQQPEIIAQASFDLQTSAGFADFTHFPEDSSSANLSDSSINAEQKQHSLPPAGMAVAAPSVTLPPTRISLQSNQRVSAFEVYRKPHNSQSPPTTSAPTGTAPSTQFITTSTSQQQHCNALQHQQYANQLTHPTPPMPFGAIGAAAIAAQHQQQNATTSLNSVVSTLPSAELFEKRVTAISETLRYVSFNQTDRNMSEVLHRLREQNSLLLLLCNDLSDELLIVHSLKEEMRQKLGSTNLVATNTLQFPATAAIRTVSSISAPVAANVTGGSGGSSGGHTNV